jgi:tetratricopeptide (TPR) repeat protein
LAIVVGVLLLTRLPSLLAAGANSLATRALLPEWEGVSQGLGFPRCERGLEASAAEPYLAQALRWDPGSQRTLVNQGRVDWLTGTCDAAGESWAQALLVAPTDHVAAFWTLWASGGDPRDLPDPLRADALANYAFWTGRDARKKDTSAMRAWLQLALDLSPDREMGARVTGLYRNNEKVAHALWERLAATLPEDEADHWWAIARMAELEEDPARAAWAYRQGVEVAADAYPFWMAYAATLEGLESWEEAEAAYGQALISRPDVVRPYLKLGDLRAGQGDFDGALAWYNEAQAVDETINPFYLAAMVHYGEGQDAQARAWLEEALALDPEHAPSLYYMAQVLYRLGEKVQAVTFLERAVLARPRLWLWKRVWNQPPHENSWKWAMQLGDWRLELEDREGALAAYEQALGWQPGEASIQERIQRARDGE